MNHCIDLFSGLGGFSAAFRDSPNWNVTTVERDEQFTPDIPADIWNVYPSDLPDADVIMASPPCKQFSTAGNHDHWNRQEPTADAAKDAVGLVHHTLGLIEAIQPRYWFLENPRGRMRYVLGDPEGTVHYCQYGKEYKKPTDLWGNHPVLMEYRQCRTPAGGGCHARNATNSRVPSSAMSSDPAERAKVPYELSESILRAVEGNQPQTTLLEVGQ